MERTVCELFAGVGGFRCGLNSIRTVGDVALPEKWETVWFNQWEPADKKVQWAHGCYVHKFGQCLDINGKDTTNTDIHSVDKRTIPDHNLLVGGFPCQDYSVASSSSKGIEGKKGVLWWDIRDILETKRPAFVLLENVDRLIKSPAKQRGRDFGIILACFRDLGYAVEWRVINAADYGYQQRRRRTFIFACRNDTAYARRMEEHSGGICGYLMDDGFFSRGFPIAFKDAPAGPGMVDLPGDIRELSDSFSFRFENSGVMHGGTVYTLKGMPIYDGERKTLGDILEDGDVGQQFSIPKERLYYTSPDVDHSDETKGPLPEGARRTWQYIKGAKRIMRTAVDGYEYAFSEGAIPMVDGYGKPARTMLTSEGSFSRTTHVVKDKQTGDLRLLTPVECERIQGFPDNWTKECLADGRITEMPVNKRRFMMGNALVVDLVRKMEERLSEIFEEE